MLLLGQKPRIPTLPAMTGGLIVAAPTPHVGKTVVSALLVQA